MVFIQSRALPVIEQVSIQSKVDRQVAWINACILPVDDAWREYLWRREDESRGLRRARVLHATSIARLRNIEQKILWYGFISRVTARKKPNFSLCVCVCAHVHVHVMCLQFSHVYMSSQPSSPSESYSSESPNPSYESSSLQSTSSSQSWQRSMSRSST